MVKNAGTNFKSSLFILSAVAKIINYTDKIKLSRRQELVIVHCHGLFEDKVNKIL